MSEQWKEPTRITQGDTVSFKKALPDYPARDGWTLTYALRGNGQEIQFSSTADVDNHVILVDSSVTELWLPAEYKLEGFAEKPDGERKSFYLGSLTITPDLETAPADLDTRTHAQKMLSSIEAELEKCAKNILLSTTVEGTTVLRERRLELLKLRQSYLQERRGEIAAERARNGKPSQRKIKTVLSIMPPGSIAGAQFGAGNSVFNTQFP